MNLKKYNFQHGKLGVDPRLKLTNDPSPPKLSNYHSFFLSNEVFFQINTQVISKKIWNSLFQR